MPKGQKICPSCGLGQGPRNYLCKNCNYDFKAGKPAVVQVKDSEVEIDEDKAIAALNQYFENKEAKQKKPTLVSDFKTLSPGQKVKIKGGPFYVTREGVKISMGSKGVFRVHRVEKEGFWAFKQGGSRSFIYMGETRKMEETGITRKAHKVKLLKSKE